jgi:hypothetical protein
MTKQIKNSLIKILNSYLIVTVLSLQVFSMIPGDKFVLLADDQNSCAEKLEKAEEHYYDGEFDQTLQLVNQCLQNQSLPKVEQIRSYTILAKTYLAKNDTVRTKDNVRIILKLDPNYQPTIEEETPRYVALVESVKKEEKHTLLAEESSGISPWWYIGAGGVAAVAIIALVASWNSGSDNQKTDTSLPDPPDFPE